MSIDVCNLDNTDQEKSLEFINRQINVWDSDYDAYFGYAMYDPETNKEKLKALKKENFQLAKSLSAYKDMPSKDILAVDRASMVEINKRKKRVEKEIKILERDLPVAQKKAQKLADIKTTILKQLSKFAEYRAYDVNHEIIFSVVADWIEKQFTTPLGAGFDSDEAKTLPKMDYKTLISIHNQLKKLYEFNDKAAEEEGKIGKYKGSFYDPARVMLETDPTGKGYKFINRTREMNDEMYSDTNSKKRIFTGILNRLKHSIAKTIDSKEDQNKQLIADVKMVHEILDSEKRQIKPIAMYEWATKKDGTKIQVFTAEFKEDLKEFKRLLNDAILSKVGAGQHLQKYVNPNTNQIHYYIPIKHTNEDGSEIWHAYEVAYIAAGSEYVQADGTLGKSKIDRFVYPPHSKNQQRWKDFMKDGGLAPVVNELGTLVKGAMSEGLYGSTNYKRSTREAKSGTKYNVSSYDAFTLTGEKVDDRVWHAIVSLRGVLKEIKTDVTQKIKEQEKQILFLTNQIITGKLVVDMPKAELEETLNQVLGLDGFNLNFSIRNGEIITPNHFFGEQENYVTHMYALTTTWKQLQEGIMEVQERVDALKEEHSDASIEGKVEEALAKSVLLQQTEDTLDMMKTKLNISIGMQDKNIEQPVNAATMIRYIKARTGMMNPLQIEDPFNPGRLKNEGRRKDFGVFMEYTDNMYQDVHYNELKVDLLDSLPGTTKATSDFLIDHAKASIGRLDVNAGMFGWDYSDDKVAKLATKFTRAWYKTLYAIPFTKRKHDIDDLEVTKEMIHFAVKMQSMWISGGLLKWGSALNNNFQRLSGFIETQTVNIRDVIHLVNDNEELASALADEAGVTDTIVAIADNLIGTIAGDATTTSGVRAVKNFALLKLSKNEFLRKVSDVSDTTGTWWRDTISTHVLKGVEGHEKIDTSAREDMADNIWEIVNGVKASEEMTPAQIRAMKKRLSRMLEKKQADAYVGWALGGGFLSSSKGATKVISFTGSEIQMRKELFFAGVLEAKNQGLISEEWIEENKDNIAEHGSLWYAKNENAKRFGRVFIYNTLFGMSTSYMPKAFRGAVGTILFKFKPYQWHQARNEWRTMRNWFLARDGENPLDTVATLINPTSIMDRKMQKFILSRGLVSLSTTLLFYTPVLGNVIKFLTRNILNPTMTRAMGRGGESVILSAIFRTVLLGVFMAGATDDDDIPVEWYHIFTPMIASIIIDTFTGDPLKIMQVYSRGAYKLTHGIGSGISSLFD